MARYDEAGLIIYLCEKAEKVGKQSANSIADFFENSFEGFCKTDNLANFLSVKRRQRFSQEQINSIKSVIAKYVLDKNKPIREIWISVLIKDFVKKALKELRSTSFENMLINPFLVKAFGFDDHKEVVTFYFYQKITRSVVTSWGFVAEDILKCIGAEKSELGGFDLKVRRDDKNIHFQIKSSPNTMSVEQVRALNTHISKVEDIVNNILLLGVTYGTKSQINSQVQGNLIGFPNGVMAGKELWDFIANEEGYWQKVLNLIDETMKTEPVKFSDELEKKLLLLIEDWERQFGTGRSSIELVLSKYM